MTASLADTPVLPQEPEIERILLGALLLKEDPNQIPHIRRELRGSAFTVRAHREIFDELCEMLDRGDPINHTILQMRLRAKGSSVGPVEIMTLIDGVPLQSDLSAEIQILKDVLTRREIMRCAEAWSTEAQAPDVDLPSLLGAIRDRTGDFIHQSAAKQAAPISISWGELCEMKLERRETILHEVERGEIVMCPAITNRGKTTLWRNIGISIACGKEFAPIVGAGTPRSVLYLDFETRLYRARSDINKMLGHLSQDQRAMVANNFHLIADCRIEERPLTLSNPRHLEIVEAEARRVKADVIILDTLTAAFEVENENDNAEAARVMKKLTALALRLNCVVVFLHHIGKAKQEEGQTVHAVHRARGASAYSGFSHAIFSLLPDPILRERNTLECAKVKGERFEDTVFNLDVATRWFVQSGPAPKPIPIHDQVVGIFNGQPLKKAEIAKRFPGLSDSRLDKILRAAVDAGDLTSPTRGTYEKPVSVLSADPIGMAESTLSTQPIESKEDSLGFGGWDENEAGANEDGETEDEWVA